MLHLTILIIGLAQNAIANHQAHIVNNDAREQFTCPVDDCKITKCRYLNPNDCNTFWKCYPDGRQFLERCPSNTEWNDFIKACDWPSANTCKPGLTPAPSPPSSTPSSPSIPNKECTCGVMFGDFCGSRANKNWSQGIPLVPLKGNACLANGVYGCAREDSPAQLKHYCNTCNEHGDVGKDACANVKIDNLM